MRMEKSRRKSPVILIAALFIFGPAGTVSAAVYYAATDGSDFNPGTIGQPWRTIQHAADEIRAGDTVYIRGGTYNENISTTRSGSAGAYIVFSAYSGETPVIDGTGMGGSGFVVEHSYIKLSGLEICNWDNDHAIWVDGAGYLEISDCLLHHVECGIKLLNGSHDFVLNRVDMHHFFYYGFEAEPGTGADCYNGTLNDCVAHTGRDPTQNVDGFAIEHASQHDFVFNRCQAYDVFDGFDAGAGTYNVTFNRCLARDCSSGFKVWGDNNMVNCISYHCTYANVDIGYQDAGYPPTTATLQNCTFVDGGGYNIIVEHPEVKSLHMYNCILAENSNIGLLFYFSSDISNYQGDYNIFHNDNPNRAIVTPDQDYSLGDWKTYSGQDANSFISTDPATQLFQNLSSWNLHLRAGSIAIDKGTSSGAPSVDYDGKPRPQGGGYDIGAYEYGAAPPVPTPTPAGPAPTPLPPSAPPWIYDYNGDGTSDIGIFRGSSGLWSVRGVTRVYFGGSSDRPVPGDYDGNGTTDIGIFRAGSGLWAVRGVTRSYFGSSSDLPVPGDYNGDGNCDIGVFRESAGLWAIRGVTRAYFGASGDTPVPGYYAGGGTKDIGLFRGSAGLWAIRGVTRTYFGCATDEVVPGDYNGDGSWDIGIFRPAGGLWAVRRVTRSYFGSSSDRPVPADYSGNSIDDIGIFRSGSGLWAVRGITRVYFGGSSDIPVTR